MDSTKNPLLEGQENLFRSSFTCWNGRLSLLLSEVYGGKEYAISVNYTLMEILRSKKQKKKLPQRLWKQCAGISSFLKLHQLEEGNGSSNLGRKKMMLKQSLQSFLSAKEYSAS